MLTDTHCHFEDERYDTDRARVIDENLKELAFCINVATNINDFDTVLDLAAKHEKIYASLGIHPHYALKVTPEEVKEKIIASLPLDSARDDRNKIVAVGECGLDYHFFKQDLEGRTEYELREAQEALLVAQIEAAQKSGLPMIIHTRDEQGGWDAYQDVLRIFEEHKVTSATIHSFSGDVKFAKEFTERGMYLGISGILTFDKTGRLPEVIKEISLDRLLLETDAPYLTPVPNRGKRNEPKFVKFTAQKIAEIKNITLEEVLSTTEQNARKLFGIVVE